MQDFRQDLVNDLAAVFSIVGIQNPQAAAEEWLSSHEKDRDFVYDSWLPLQSVSESLTDSLRLWYKYYHTHMGHKSEVATDEMF